MKVRDDLKKVVEKLDNMFMVFILHDLPKEHATIKDQALTNIVIPTVEVLIDRLIRVSLPSDHTHTASKSSALISNSNDHGTGGCGHGQGRGHGRGVEVASVVLIVREMDTLKTGASTCMVIQLII